MVWPNPWTAHRSKHAKVITENRMGFCDRDADPNRNIVLSIRTIKRLVRKPSHNTFYYFVEMTTDGSKLLSYQFQLRRAVGSVGWFGNWPPPAEFWFELKR
jgi:hypothetical protein